MLSNFVQSIQNRAGFVYIFLNAGYRFASALFGVIYTLYLIQAGLSNFLILLPNVVFHIVGLLLELPTGVVADLYGKKISTALGFLSYGVGIGIYALTSNIWVFVLAECVAAAGNAFMSGATDSWLIEKVGLEKANKIFSKSGFWSNIASIPAGILAGYIGFFYGFKSVIYLEAGLFILLFFISILIMSKDTIYTHQKKGLELFIDSNKEIWRLFWSNKQSVRLTLISSILSFCIMSVFMFWQPNLQNSGLSIENLGIVSAGFGLAMGVGSYLAGHLKFLQKIPSNIQLSLSLIWQGISVLLASYLLNFNPWLAVLFIWIFEIGYGFYNPLLTILFNQDIEAKWRSSLNSFRSLVQKIGTSIGLLCIGLLADLTSRQTTWLVAGIIILISGVLSFKQEN